MRRQDGRALALGALTMAACSDPRTGADVSMSTDVGAHEIAHAGDANALDASAVIDTGLAIDAPRASDVTDAIATPDVTLDARSDIGFDAADATSRDALVADVPPRVDGAPVFTCMGSFLESGGSDSNPGTQARPWATFGYALRALRAGDTLCVRGGTYLERVRAASLALGTAAAPIRVVAVPGERVVVQGIFWITAPTFWSFTGINVTWNTANAHDEHMVKFTDGADWEFTDAEVWGAQSFAGILVAGAPARWALRRLHVHDTADLAVTGHSVNQDHLIYVNAQNGPGVIERSLLTHSPNGRAIKLGPPACGAGATTGVSIRYNTMFDNRGPSNVQFSCESHDNETRRNLMVGALSGRANVTGFTVTGANNIVVDNVGWDSIATVESGSGVIDGGGNLHVDPMFTDVSAGDFHPRNTAVRAFGVYAP